MSSSLRFVLLDPSGEVIRLSHARFQRLFSQPPRDKLPDFADKRIRAAEIVVELRNRRPVRVVRAVYHYLNFDHEGALDYDRYMEEGMVPLLASPDSWPRPEKGSRIVPAQHRFAARRLNVVVRWKPTATEERAISEAALGDRKYRRI